MAAEEDEKGISRNGGRVRGHQQEGIVHGLFLFLFFCFFVGFLDRLLSLHTSHWIVCNFLHAGFNRIESIDKIIIIITTTEEKRRQREEERKSG